MLSSIHPLGERARQNRWLITVAAFGLAAVTTGSLIGAVLATIGAPIAPEPETGLFVVSGAALVAAVLDLMRIPSPGLKRQVNERWIGFYRGWVYGAGFGAQLGAGVATYVVSWTVWVVFLAELVAGSPRSGALIGAAFGFGRFVPVAAGGWIDRPSRLTATTRMLARMGRRLIGGLTTMVLLAGGIAMAVGLG